MKRVLITFPDFEIGGFVSHTCNLAAALRAQGYHVTALAFEPFGACLPDVERAVDEVCVLWRGWETANQFLRRVVARIRDLTPDVFVNNSVGFAQAAVPFLPASTIRLSVVHSIVEQEQRLALTHYEQLDWVIAVADIVADSLRRIAPEIQRLQTVPVGVAMGTPRVAGLQYPKGPLRLVYLGRLAPEKNLPVLLQILGRLFQAGARFQMTIIGSGPEESWLKNEVARLPFASSIHLKGAIPHGQVMAELAAHDMLLMTSRYEGTPHVVLEAMSCGLSVVCSNLPGSTDRIITHGVNGFLCAPADSEAFATVIRDLLNQPDRYAEVSRQARETIRAQYSMEFIGGRYHECILRAASRPGRAMPPPADSAVLIDAALKPFCPGFCPNALHYAKDLAKQILIRRHPVQLAVKPRAHAVQTGG